MISSSNKLCASKMTMRFAGLPLTCVEVVVHGCRCWKGTNYSWKTYEIQWSSVSLKGDRGGFGESILKRNVFSEALATLFPTAILQIDYTAVHIALSTNPLVWWPLLVTILNIINYPFVNVNVSKRLKSSKGVLILPLQALGVIEIAWHCQNNIHSQFWRNRQIYI